MADEQKSKLRLEIAYVLFIDIVGYSKLRTNEQSAQIETLRNIVRGTEQFRAAEAEGKLLRLPTGDGGALAFRNSPEAPVLCAGDGLGLWVSTHRDDCAKLFAYAAMNPKTFSQSYNATRDQQLTWRDYYAQVAKALGKSAQLIFMPAWWIIDKDPSRFGLLREITQFHGAYSSEKAKRDVPEFKCEIEYTDGARETLADIRRRNSWRSSKDDGLYESMIEKAMALGMEPEELRA